MPIKVKKRRPIASKNKDSATNAGEEEGEEVIVENDEENVDMTGWEEYYDYVFPDDERSGMGKSVKNLRLLEMAHKWKKSAAAGAVEEAQKP